MKLCEESQLLIRHWNAVQEIKQAEARLGQEVQSFLVSLQKDVAQAPWWSRDWQFTVYETGQVYVSHEKWKVGDVPIIWVGVEGFAPGSLWGTDSPASAYVWVSGKNGELLARLREYFGKLGKDLPGSVDTKAGYYVVRQPLPTCPEEALESYGEAVKESILRFFAFCAGHAEAITRAVAEVRGQK